MVELGQRRQEQLPPGIMNVPVMGGFAYADTAKNGLSVIITARGDRQAAEALAREIAQYGWDNRARFYPKLTPLDEAVEAALAGGRGARFAPPFLSPGPPDTAGGGAGDTPFIVLPPSHA